MKDERFLEDIRSKGAAIVGKAFVEKPKKEKKIKRDFFTKLNPKMPSPRTGHNVSSLITKLAQA